MLRSILTPLDGSPASEHALPWSHKISRSTGAAMHLVRVHEVVLVPATGDGLIPNDASVIEEVARRETEYLDRIANDWRDDEAEISIVKSILDPHGSTAATLVDYATKQSIDLTIMTTHGHGPWTRAIFGSTTDEYIRTAPVPTLLIRTHTDQPPSPQSIPELHRVVVPLDGSPLSEHAIEPAIRLFEWFGCPIEFLMVISARDSIDAFSPSGGWTQTPNHPQPVKQIAEEYLIRQASRWSPKSGAVSTRVIEHNDASEAILDEASSPGVAVAMATHGRGGLSRAIFGSVADRVIRNSKSPVLVVRPRA